MSTISTLFIFLVGWSPPEVNVEDIFHGLKVINVVLETLTQCEHGFGYSIGYLLYIIHGGIIKTFCIIFPHQGIIFISHSIYLFCRLGGVISDKFLLILVGCTEISGGVCYRQGGYIYSQIIGFMNFWDGCVICVGYLIFCGIYFLGDYLGLFFSLKLLFLSENMSPPFWLVLLIFGLSLVKIKTLADSQENLN